VSCVNLCLYQSVRYQSGEIIYLWYYLVCRNEIVLVLLMVLSSVRCLDLFRAVYELRVERPYSYLFSAMFTTTIW